MAGSGRNETLTPQLADDHFEPYHDDADEDATLGDIDTEDNRGSASSSAEFIGLRLDTPVASTFRKRVARRIPPSVKRAWAATVEWVQGPRPPRIYSIHPVLPAVQRAPIVLLDRYAPKKVHRFWLLMFWYACWLLCFSLVMRASSVSASIRGHGNPIRLSCTTKYWEEGNGCGLNGDQCRPFANATMAFRCPADCHKTQQLTPHAVGTQEVVYRPLLVGGSTQEQTGYNGEIVENAVYRGDSFICASAAHAGFIKDSLGGCGVLALTGEQQNFRASKRNGYESVGFDSYFPRSFAFLKGTQAQCKDLRWPLLGVSVFFTSILSLFTTDPGVFFWSIFVGLFFHVGLASDPPDLTSFYDLLSVAFGRFLPACFCAWVTYRYSVRRSLTNLTAQFEKTILWLGPAWVGALNNYTFDRIPIQRLTPHDIKAQPGAVPALIIIILSIFSIALGQAWAFRVEGRMPRYLVIYGLMVLTLLIMLALPGLNLRIHHYILALLFLPGTSFQNRPSLIYQGLLVGLFVNGIARWGFDSILQTPGELLAGFQQDSLLPVISVLAIGSQNITFNLGHLPKRDSRANIVYEGVSVLVNDMERFRGFADDRSSWDENMSASGNFTWTWHRHQPGRRGAAEDGGEPGAASAEAHPRLDKDDATEKRDDYSSFPSTAVLPEYFRFAYVAGNRAADFTKAGVWKSDGTWQHMEDGPS